MLPFHKQSFVGLFWIRLCIAHLENPLIVIAALILAGVLAARAETADRVAKTFRDCEMCPEMVIIPSGKFIMGSPETEKDRDADEGQHTVVITYSFAVSQGPITWDLWDACVHDGACDGPSVEAALRLDRDGKPIEPQHGHDWRGGIVRIGAQHRKAIAVVEIEAIFGAEPEVSPAVLQDVGDDAL